jgi:type IV pilus assembly protein PilM
MPRAVGLDIGSRTIKVVEITGGPKAFRVQRFVVRPVPEATTAAGPEGAEGPPPDPDEALSRVVRELFDELKLPKDDVCASLGAGSTLLREFPVPFKEESQIRKVIRFEMENHLHSHPIEEMVVNSVKTGETREGSRILGFASPKADLLKRLAVLRRAGIEPASVDLDATALYTACHSFGVFEATPNAMILDVGAQTTNLLLVCGGQLRFVRSVLLGVGGIESGISRDLDVSLPEGRRQARATAGPRPGDLLIPSGVLDPDAPPDEKSLAELQGEAADERRQDFVKRLHREATRSISAAPADARPDRVLVCGGGSLLPGVLESLGTRLGLPVERLDLASRVPWKSFGGDAEFAQAAGISAVGCALRMLGVNPLGIELLQDEFAPTNLFDVVKTALATGITLLFLVLLGLTIVARTEFDAERRRYNHVWAHATEIGVAAEKAYLQTVESKTDTDAEREIRQYLTKEIPQDHTRLAALKSRLLKHHRTLREQLGWAKGVQPVPSALEVWVEIVKALSSVERNQLGAWFQIRALDVSPRQARLTVVVDNKDIFDEVRRLLTASPYFAERARNASQIVEPQDQKKVAERWEQSFDFRFAEEE